jgi:hypothetical protein
VQAGPVKRFRSALRLSGEHLESWRNLCTQEGNR